MGTLFALVLTVGMTNGDYQDVILDIYTKASSNVKQRQLTSESTANVSLLKGL